MHTAYCMMILSNIVDLDLQSGMDAATSNESPEKHLKQGRGVHVELGRAGSI